MNCNIPVSVIMPCYNAEKYVAEAVESILNQSFSNFEFIILDDASTDNSYSIINSYKDSRIKLISNTANIGNYKLRNMGMRYACGKYLCVMDADDIAEKNKLAVQYKFLEKNINIGLIGSYGNMINENGVLIGSIKKPLHHNQITVSLIAQNCFIHPSIMMRSEAIRKYYLQYDKALYYSADYDFVRKCAQKFTICNLENPLINYRTHKEQISSCKHAQQIKYGDIVRLRQLHLFKTKYSEEEKNVHLKIVKKQLLLEDEFKIVINFYNKLLSANEKMKIFNQKILFHSLQNLLKTSLFFQKTSILH